MNTNEGYTEVAEEDKKNILFQLGGIMKIENNSTAPCHCCGIVSRDRYPGLNYSKLIHSHFRPAETITEDFSREMLVIPDATGNLTFTWDDK